MAQEFTKEPIPYISNKTYLWRFIQGSVCGLVFGVGIGNLGFGIGAAVGIGVVFALRPKNKNHILITILALSVGICAGIGRILDMLAPSIALGLILGYGIYYFYKFQTAKSVQTKQQAL